MENKGITMIALIVTIVILLILAGITIGTLTGENGLIGTSKEAKEQTEIENEKEILEQATVEAMGKEKYGNLTKDNLEEVINRLVGEEKTELNDLGDKIEVSFIDSKRYYEIDSKGNVGDYQEIIEDKSPGDITKDKNGNTLAGTPEQPYEIWCIEDLCEFSNLINNSTAYRRITVKLMRDLDFKSKFSYINGIIQDEGSIPSCQTKEELMKFLSKEETGFIPISAGKNNGFFAGNFDGNNKAIRNIYINVEGSAGLFGVFYTEGEGEIKDLTITGEIIATEGSAGGICAVIRTGNPVKDGRISNCKNYANITSMGEENYAAGGIVGEKTSGDDLVIIQNCSNFGEIKGNENTGGIIGHGYKKTNIINCYNTQEIRGITNVGGIAGQCYFIYNIYNCYNFGNIIAEKNAGGMSGWIGWSSGQIRNCYNIGNLTGSSIGGIVGAANTSDDLLKTSNLYFLTNLASQGIGGWNEEERAEIYTKEQMQSEELVNELNTYIEQNEETDTTNWKKWKYIKNGYPIFSD